MTSFKYHIKRYAKKRYDGIDVPKQNSEIKPFVVHFIIHKKINTQHVGGGRRSHVTLKCCQKGKVLSTHFKVSRRKRHWSIINLTTMIQTTRTQFPKQIVKAMVAVNMSPMPPKIIGRKTCLWVKRPFKLLKDLGPKKHPNT